LHRAGNLQKSARASEPRLGPDRDLQSGNLSAAQADFATLQQIEGQSGSSSSTETSGSITQEFTQLAADLKAGNLAAAQQDFTVLQKTWR